ncbi:NAD(P)/FAD-dependent oxidoreductase [Leptothrix sp. BB-4]
MPDCDVLILGAGIAGASLAWTLASTPAHHGRRVVLAEREDQPGRHATGRSAAMFMESYGPPGVRALTRASRAFYERPPAGFLPEDAAPLLTPRSVLYVAFSGQETLLATLRDELAGTGLALQVIDADACCARVPCLRRDGLVGALLDPSAEDIDVHALHQGYLRGLKRLGGELRTRTAPREARHDGAAWVVTFEDGQVLRAGCIVNACGAWADEVAVLFGATPLGLEPRRRSAFTFAAPDGADVSGWPAVVGVDEGWYFKPDAGRLLGSPANADPAVPHDVRPEELDIALGIHRIEAATTLSIRRPASTWAGLRTFAADGELVIGPDAHVPGFFWLAGQGGYGIQSAAGAAALAAALLNDNALPAVLADQGVDPARFAPVRFEAGRKP